MVIGFKPQFVPKILSGQKIHTIRLDPHNRWKEGMTMHMATGVRTKNYHCFKTVICTGVEKISIISGDNCNHDIFLPDKYHGKCARDFEIEQIAKNDGFDSVGEFWKWFNKPFAGKILYWTNFKY